MKKVKGRLGKSGDGRETCRKKMNERERELHFTGTHDRGRPFCYHCAPIVKKPHQVQVGEESCLELIPSAFFPA